jgi:hypothetical protein
MTEQTTGSPSVEKWRIPFGATMEFINTTLKTYYQAGAGTKFVSRDEIIKKGIGRTPLVNNVPFLLYLGALEKDKADPKLCKLTTLGLDYSKATYENDAGKMKTTLKALIEFSFKDLADYTNIQKATLDFSKIFNHIKTTARIKEDEKYPWKVNPAYQVGIFALIDMLRIAGFIDENIKPPSEKPVSKVIQRQPKVTAKRIQQDKIPDKQVPASRLQIGTQIQAQVTIDVKDDKSIANFLKMMQILKRINDGEDLNVDDEIALNEAGASGS